MLLKVHPNLTFFFKWKLYFLYMLFVSYLVIIEHTKFDNAFYFVNYLFANK